MDEDSSRLRYVERKGGGLHPAVDRKRLNILKVKWVRDNIPVSLAKSIAVYSDKTLSSFPPYSDLLIRSNA